MVQKQTEKQAPQEQKETTEVKGKDVKNEELGESTDDLMDEIDNILDEVRGEQSASQFVKSYVQRGGQ